MCINQLIVKGGYGEHGRSCFIVPFGEDRYYMLDCGIMDTDEQPYPVVEDYILAKTEYLFLSHSHKDHSGAFSRLVSKGFHGWLVTSAATMEFADIHYKKVILADPSWKKPVRPGQSEERTEDDRKAGDSQRELRFICGRSGHCAGGLWFQIWSSSMSCFYSGDFQGRPLAFAVDEISGKAADLAIIDCAHPDTLHHADALRRELFETINAALAKHRRVILPLPKYGRGAELIVFLEKMLPGARIAADRDFDRTVRKVLAHREWLQPQAAEAVERFLAAGPCDNLVKNQYDILLLADAHLEREENRKLVGAETGCGALKNVETGRSTQVGAETGPGALVIATGRVKAAGFVNSLLEQGKAVRCFYPHHQSMGDFMETMGRNSFRTVLPFHNERKEVYFCSS